MGEDPAKLRPDEGMGERPERSQGQPVADPVGDLGPSRNVKIYLSDYYYNLKYAETAYRQAYEASLIKLKTNKSEDNYKTSVRNALMSSEFNESLRLAKEGLSLFPQDLNLGLNRAHAMLLLGQKKEAIAVYKKAYADLKRSERYADKAAQMMTDDFAILVRRYPDKASELKWAEGRIREP